MLFLRSGLRDFTKNLKVFFFWSRKLNIPQCSYFITSRSNLASHIRITLQVTYYLWPYNLWPFKCSVSTGCVTWFQILETNYRYGSYQDNNYFLVLYHYNHCSVSCSSAITNVRSKLIIFLVIRIYLFCSLFFFKPPRWCFLLSY